MQFKLQLHAVTFAHTLVAVLLRLTLDTSIAITLPFCAESEPASCCRQDIAVVEVAFENSNTHGYHPCCKTGGIEV